MLGGTASWHFLDVESGHLPDEASSSLLPRSGEGRIVVLAATPFARAGGWAGRAVVAVTTAWAREGRRIFLMDLGLETPSLHEVLELPNHEGVTDAFLFGASVQRIARPTPDGAIFFASAGTPTANPEEVLRHPRWHDLAGGFSETDATLLLFLPTDIPGGESILRLATDVIFLAAEGESADALLGPASVKLLATLGPLASLREAAWDPGKVEEPPTRMGAALDAGAPDPVDSEGREASEAPKAPPPDEEDLASRFRVPEGFHPVGPGEEEVEEIQVNPEPGLVGPEQGSTWRTPSDALDVPDFGAEFAELPPLEDEVAGAGVSGRDVGDLGKDLVSGPDFGIPPGEVRGPEAGPEVHHPGLPHDPGERESTLREEESTAAPPRPRPRRRPPPRKRSVGSLLAVLLVLAAVALTAGTVFGVFSLPGFGVFQGLRNGLPEPPLALPGPQPNEPLLRYSLELFRYQEDELAFAGQMRDELRSRLPDLLFVLAPDASRGGLTWALLAGPAETLIDVENVRAALGTVITREDAGLWRVRETPRAFVLGEAGTLREARELLASAEEKGVFAYVLHATYPGGTDAFLVLAGAYQGVEEARALQAILHRQGFVGAPLVERRGRFPG
jgi:hypothetical protein